MPLVGYKQTKEHRRAVVLARSGYKHSAETLKKMANSHLGQTPWNKGKKHSEKSIQKMRDSHRKENLSAETIKKIREARKKQIISEETKVKISQSNMGHEVSPETRRKIGKAHKGKIIPEWQREKIRISVLKNFNKRFKDTEIELKIESELKLRHIKYLKQVPLCNIGCVDFYIPNNKIVIQADGCYWHNCQIHKKNLPLPGKTERDIHQSEVLTSNGFRVFRFWEHEINESVKKCIDKLGL